MDPTRTRTYRYLTLATLLASVGWVASSPGWEPGIVLIGSLAAYLVSERPNGAVPSLSGRWEYEVVTADRKFSHKGDCHVHQNGTSVRVEGHRLFSCNRKTKDSCSEVSIPWGTDWCQICDDGTLRFDYHIAIKEPRRGDKFIEAICRLKINSDEPEELSGNYYTLPPFDESTLNCKWGTIVFRRIGKSDVVSPPELAPANEPPEEIA